jgi:hypothetical protein
MEQWRPVVGYERLYEVSDRGRVRSVNRIIRGVSNCSRLRHGVVRRPHTNQDGYLRIELWRENRGRKIFVHRLVLEAFIGAPPTADHEGNHKDGNRANNVLSNLEWLTPEQNVQHAYQVLGRKAARHPDFWPPRAVNP